MDRISELPECIVHHILSSLNTPEELLRMSVLSKHWFDLTATFPILDFNMDNFRSPECYFKYVEYTTSRFCHQNVTAHTFKLITTLKEPAELDIVNRCLELVLKNGVTDLEIKFIDVSSAMPKYRLPNTLLSVSMLKSLTISDCELPSSLMVDVVQFKSLIRLELKNIDIDDEVIKYITTSFPLLESFQIRGCRGFKKFCVYRHQNLGLLYITCNTQVERIDIEAPNLSTLLVENFGERGAPRMNMASCKKLKSLIYFGYPLPNSNGFTNFLSNFPFVQNLVLSTSFEGNNLKLSSHSLRTLVLYSDCDLEDIEFKTPNLDLFIYTRNHLLLCTLVIDILVLWPRVRRSTYLKACMQCYLDSYIDSLWFFKLRLFLDKRNGFKVLNLYIHTIDNQKFTELEKLKAIEVTPYELKHVELKLDAHKESLAHIAFVDAVLWCCRPQSLTLTSPSPLTDFEDVVKTKLLQQEDEGHTNIHIVWPSSTKAQRQFRDLMPFPRALVRKGESVNFRKEKVLQEETG